MQTDFVPSLSAVLRSEGGFVNDPHDPGGATNYGVTQKEYNAFRATKGLYAAAVKFIPLADVASIYRFQYWDQVRGDDLPTGIDYAIFDEAVNSGPVKSVKDLQTALGVKVDGHLGMMTLTALDAVKDVDALINKICDLRLNYLHRLKTWRWFGKGWKSRVATVRAGALKMSRPTSVAAVPRTTAVAASQPIVLGHPAVNLPVTSLVT